jgi:hypothetical protein
MRARSQVTVNRSDDVFSNQRYRVALTIAIILFLLTLTAAIVIIIIASAREADRENMFEVTLTAAFNELHATQTAAFDTPTPAPTLVYGQYPFALAPDSPHYSASPACVGQVVTGRVLDEGGNPVDGFQVQVWGDYAVPPQTLPTGQLAGQDRGHWTLTLEGVVNRRVWVQLTAADRYFSGPLEIVFAGGDCTRNQVEVVFQQIAPLR